MDLDDLGFVYFGGLGIDENDSSGREICFLAGRDGEAYVSREEVVRLNEYLTTYLNSKTDAEGQ